MSPVWPRSSGAAETRPAKNGEQMSDTGEKVAVVLFNLGGPDRKDSIKPFLFNFFMDPNIIDLPRPLRWVLAKVISITRSRKEAGEAYDMLGGKSPLLDNTRAQARALETALKIMEDEDGHEFKVFISMRYWHPMSHETARNVKEWGADRIVLMPLYPQFSTTTTWSSLGVWNTAAKDIGLELPTSMICCWPRDRHYVSASSTLLRESYDTALTHAQEHDLNPPRILFSAHGLPKKVIEGGDPYQWQCEQSAEAIVAEMDVPMLDWQVCYQSRVGPLEWIGPSTEEALQKAAEDKVPVIVYPHAFVSEHVETLVEIEIEYREMAKALGIPYFSRVPTVSTHEDFIDGMAELVLEYVDKPGIRSNEGQRICPGKCKRCCMVMDVKVPGQDKAVDKSKFSAVEVARSSETAGADK